ncbi:MAG TPA: iron-containing alcohol dehydrogenase [Alphaproteobacteria bacterium]|nr:iron-containing alcohol dehydrogenase [Alphaproteobacteria bacterium]
MAASYYNPVKLVHGPGALEEMPRLLTGIGIKKPLVVTDKTIAAQPFFQTALERLESAHVPVALFDGCLIDARASHIQEQATRVTADGLDGVIGIGGGSIMCCAKGVATLVPNGNEIRPLEKSANIRNPALPMLLVPTTAGSGTEVSPSTIVKDDINGGKFTFVSPRAFARTAVLDPVVLETIPPALSAISAADALTHAVEAVLSYVATPLTDAIALGAVRSLVGSVKASIKDNDEGARAEHLLAATMANLACGAAKLGLGHRLSRPLEETFSINHGLGVGTIMLRATGYLGDRFPEKLPALAQAFGLDASGDTNGLKDRIVAAIAALYEEIGFPAAFDTEEVDAGRLREMAEMAVTRTTDDAPAPEVIDDDTPITGSNGQQITVSDAEALYRACLA